MNLFVEKPLKLYWKQINENKELLTNNVNRKTFGVIDRCLREDLSWIRLI